MTQLESAKNGIATPEMKAVASAEGIALDSLVSAIADGAAVMADRGFTYRQILQHYYPGATLE